MGVLCSRDPCIYFPMFTFISICIDLVTFGVLKEWWGESGDLLKLSDALLFKGEKGRRVRGLFL